MSTSIRIDGVHLPSTTKSAIKRARPTDPAVARRRVQALQMLASTMGDAA